MRNTSTSFLASLLFLIFLVSCDQNREVEINIDKPNLGKSLVEEYKTNKMVEYWDMKVEGKIPFYKSDNPLVFVAAKIPSGLPIGIYPRGEMIAILYDFGKWRNEFFNSEDSLKKYGISVGARTIENTTNQVLAEGRFLRMIPKEGFEIEEERAG